MLGSELGSRLVATGFGGPLGALVLAQGEGDGDLGEGNIDNYIIEPDVHRIVGIIVLVAFAVLTAWLIKLALRREPYDTPALALTIAAQVVLAVQVLLGIKLLDQGMGIFQLYIHYVGGLLPLAIFLGLSWFSFRDPVRKARVLAVAVVISLLIVGMTFFIGEQFANRYSLG